MLQHNIAREFGMAFISIESFLDIAAGSIEPVFKHPQERLNSSAGSIIHPTHYEQQDLRQDHDQLLPLMSVHGFRFYHLGISPPWCTGIVRLKNTSSVQSFDWLGRRGDMSSVEILFQFFFLWRRPLWAVLAWRVMSTLWCCPCITSSADQGVVGRKTWGI